MARRPQGERIPFENEAEEYRKDAGSERIEKARQAGIKRPGRF